jgi:hypothetical protein
VATNGCNSGRQQATAEITLSSIYSELAKRFERDLGFEQLTKSRTGK